MAKKILSKKECSVLTNALENAAEIVGEAIDDGDRSDVRPFLALLEKLDESFTCTGDSGYFKRVKKDYGESWRR